MFFPFQDYEARINLLRKRSNQVTETQSIEASEPSSSHEGEQTSVSASDHIDLFADHEDKQKKVKPMDEEKRLEQEKYEKQIGYLTYLGQDTHEALGTRSWYNAAPNRDSKSECNEKGEEIEVGIKVKHLHDPMLQFLKKPITVEKSKSNDKSNSINIQSIEIPKTPVILEKSRKRSASPEKKHKKSKRSKKERKDKKKKHKKEKRKRKRSSSESSDSEAEQIRQLKVQNLQKLREERLQRERNEKNRTKEFLREKCPSLLPPEEIKKPIENTTEQRIPHMKQKYNSQFNPFLAKQNYGN